MAELPNWRCHEGIPTEQLKLVVQAEDLELLINPGGVFSLLRGRNKYLLPGGYQRLVIYNPNPIPGQDPYTVGYGFENYPYTRTLLPQTPADVPLNGLHWEGTIRFTSETSSIGYLYINNRPLISRDFEAGTSTVTEDASKFFTRYQDPFLASLNTCSDLIYAGLKIIELAYRGERAPVGGYHINFADNEKLASAVTLDLVSANLRLADFRLPINPLLT